MSFDHWININSILLFLLIIFRIGGVFISAPMISNSSISPKLKIFFIVAISAILFPIVPKVDLSKLLTNLPLLVISIVSEMTIGFTLGFVASIVTATIETAGEIFGMQLGFSIATILDPANEDSSGVITSFYTIIGSLIFLYLDGHHVIFEALGKSFQFIPLTHPFNLQIGTGIGMLTAKILVIGIQMAAPVLIVLTVLNFSFALIGKVSPQMNIYMNTGFIFGPVIGIIALMVTLPLFRVLMTQLTEQLGPDLSQAVHALRMMH